MLTIQKCRLVLVTAWAFTICCGTCVFNGCERKERVLDVETPEGELEVDRNIDTGEVEVNVTDKD